MKNQNTDNVFEMQKQKRNKPKKNKYKSNDLEDIIPYDRASFGSAEEYDRRVSKVKFIRKILVIYAIVSVILPAFLVYTLDINIRMNVVAISNLLVLLIDAILLIVFRGMWVVSDSLSKSKDDVKERIEKVYLSGDTLLYPLLIYGLISISSCAKYNYPSFADWGKGIAVLTVLIWLLFRFAKIIRTNSFWTNFGSLFVIAFIGFFIMFWGVYLTASHSYKDVTVVDRRISHGGGKYRRTYYNVTFVDKDNKKEEIEVSKNLYNRAGIYKTGYFLDMLDGPWGLDMYHMKYWVR